jgi:hypothetical protein
MTPAPPGTGTRQEPAITGQPATTAVAATTGRPATTQPPATNQPPTASATTAPAAAGEPATTEAASATTEAPASPVIEPFGRPMTARERAVRVARHWASSARQGAGAAARHPWRALCAVAVFARLAADVAETRAYIKSRAWVPDGHEGTLLPWLGRAYHYGPGAVLKAAAWLLIAAGEGLRFTADRPMRAGIALVLATGCWAGLLAGHLL